MTGIKCSLNHGPDQPLDTNGYEFNRIVLPIENQTGTHELRAVFLLPGEQACLKCIIYVSDWIYIQENSIFGCIDIE